MIEVRVLEDDTAKSERIKWIFAPSQRSLSSRKRGPVATRRELARARRSRMASHGFVTFDGRRGRSVPCSTQSGGFSAPQIQWRYLAIHLVRMRMGQKPGAPTPCSGFDLPGRSPGLDSHPLNRIELIHRPCTSIPDVNPASKRPFLDQSSAPT